MKWQPVRLGSMAVAALAVGGTQPQELLSMWARNSVIEPNLTVPWDSLASIDPSA